tara:strand:- start:28 stop:687 length:660 start_codon:yes stop_codon:yes gene_type:complete
VSNFNRFAEYSSGNVYYIRFKTPAGVFYKLGYTSADSVYDRFSFDGANDADYIDKVLLFTPLNDAYQVEQTLHSMHSHERSFGKYAAIDGLPLSRNGQSELYHKDILGLDPDSSKRKSFLESFRTINFHEKVVKGTHPALVVLAYPAAIALAIAVIVMIAVTYPIIWLLEREDEKNNKDIRNSKARQIKYEEKSKAERLDLIKRLVKGNQSKTKLRSVE